MSEHQQITIRRRPGDPDFISAVRQAADRCDRPPGHYARQLLIFALLRLGEMDLPVE